MSGIINPMMLELPERQQTIATHVDWGTTWETRTKVQFVLRQLTSEYQADLKEKFEQLIPRLRDEVVSAAVNTIIEHRNINQARILRRIPYLDVFTQLQHIEFLEVIQHMEDNGFHVLTVITIVENGLTMHFNVVVKK